MPSPGDGRVDRRIVRALPVGDGAGTERSPAPLPPHHDRVVLVPAGAARSYAGSRWVDCVPGDCVPVPFGGIHGFRTESGAPAEMLIHFAPGAPREAYFEGL